MTAAKAKETTYPKLISTDLEVKKDGKETFYIGKYEVEIEKGLKFSHRYRMGSTLMRRLNHAQKKATEEQMIERFYDMINIFFGVNNLRDLEDYYLNKDGSDVPADILAWIVEQGQLPLKKLSEDAPTEPTDS